MREETTHQLEILGAIDELEVLIKGASVMLGVYPGAGPVDTTQTVIWGYDGECVIAAGRASAECSVYRRDSGLLVNLTQAGPARVEWDLQREEFIGGGLTTFTGYTGTIDLTSATAKLSGRYAPMSGNAKATLVQADVTVSGDQETVKDYKLQGTGVLDSVDAQGASLFKTEISNLAFDMGGNAGQIVSPVLDLTLVASSPNFRFTGRIGATGVLESQTPSLPRPHSRASSRTRRSSSRSSTGSSRWARTGPTVTSPTRTSRRATSPSSRAASPEPCSRPRTRPASR
jgi:hypothetical protein